MKILRIILLFSLIVQMINGENNPYEPESDDKLNPEMVNTLGAVDILNLTGYDCSGKLVGEFVIVSLPSKEAGTLYMRDGVTEVEENQELTITEASDMKFDPKEGFVGEATFTYSAIDEFGTVDSTPATVTIPIIAPQVAGTTDTNSTLTATKKDTHCESYSDSVSFSFLLFLFLSSTLLALFIIREELA